MFESVLNILIQNTNHGHFTRLEPFPFFFLDPRIKMHGHIVEHNT